MPTVLVVDDDPPLREVVRYALARDGFVVVEAGDGAEALQRLASEEVDLILLDISMPEVDGLEVCRRIRTTMATPIVFLSSRSDEVDRVLGLELGGDDYVSKPFSPRELVSRVRAVLRRTRATPPPAPSASLEVGTLRLDPVEHRCRVGITQIELTATEFRLLHALMSHPGRVYTRDDLMRVAYSGTHFVAERTLDSHVRGVRTKLRGAGIDPIETVHGVGYRLSRG